MTRPPTPTPNTNRTKKLYGQAGNKPSSTDYRAKSGLKPSNLLAKKLKIINDT
jgi:hypothetical protein|tara:strand:+ start:2955 stop:3113 length:159 start_codon:yes stop_codon:yes gene_type:complete